MQRGEQRAARKLIAHENKEAKMVTTDPDPFEQGERAARENIPAEGNPYQQGSEQYALWGQRA